MGKKMTMYLTTVRLLIKLDAVISISNRKRHRGTISSILLYLRSIHFRVIVCTLYEYIGKMSDIYWKSDVVKFLAQLVNLG